jgi:hypothetical protein
MAGHPASVSVPSEPSLGRSGRLALAGIVIGGAILAGSDVFPLFFYVSYVPVAALLVVRRPANAVSWLLLVVSLKFDPEVVAEIVATAAASTATCSGSRCRR